MAKFTLICDHGEFGTPLKNTTEFEVDFLPEVLENFELFLRGAGFVFDGKVEIYDETADVSIESYDVDYDVDYNINLNTDFGADNMAESYNAFEQVVNNHIDYVASKQKEICSTCGLSSAVMQGQKCYDQSCPKGLG
jgi:hypothetical protein